MLIAYILTKSRFLTWKIIRLKDQGVFKKSGYEYIINRNRIYTRKLFGIKTIFWCMYLEGVPDPLEFKETSYSVTQSDVPLDEIAILMKKIIRGVVDIIILLLLAVNFLIGLAIAWKVFQ